MTVNYKSTNKVHRHAHISFVRKKKQQLYRGYPIMRPIVICLFHRTYTVHWGNIEKTSHIFLFSLVLLAFFLVLIPVLFQVPYNLL